MNKSYLAIIAIAGLLAFGAACDKENDANTNAAAVVNSGFDINEALDLNIEFEDENENVNAEDEDENENENSNINRNTNDDDEDDDVNENRNSNTNDDDEDSSGSVTITGPEKDEELESPFYVEGKATGTEVYARLIAGGTTIFEDVRISVRSGEYKGKLTFDFSRTTSGRIEIYQKDGSTETNLTSVTVRFKLSADDENDNTNEGEDLNENENDNTNDDSL